MNELTPLHPPAAALQFKIGDRHYWVSRSRDGNAWKIVANADCVEQASILHYGEVAAFVKIALRLQEIENQWAALTSGKSRSSET